MVAIAIKCPRPSLFAASAGGTGGEGGELFRVNVAELELLPLVP